MPMTPFEKTVTSSDPRSVKPLKGGKSGALLAEYPGGVKAVLKVSKRKMPSGNKTQRHLSVRSQPRREVAFYKLSKLLGFEDLVPETHMTEYEGRDASVQMFIPAVNLHELQPKLDRYGGKKWQATVVETCLKTVPRAQWQKLLALDIIAGARDRHARNVGFRMRIKNEKPEYQLVAWDNAVTFGKTFKLYHNVFHKLLFRESVPRFDDTWKVLNKITHHKLGHALHQELTEEEIRHAYLRLRFFQDYPYRLPWKVCSEGQDGSKNFPTYASYFDFADEKAPIALAA